MNGKDISRKCRCKRYKATWLCTFPNCSEFLFCKKCRKNHNRRHEENFYPIRDLMEDDHDDSHEPFEFNYDEKQKLKRKLQDEISNLFEQFDERMKSVHRKHKQYINEYNTLSLSKNQHNNLNEFRQKVRDNPYDESALKKLGREYHKYLQESNVQNVDRIKIYQKYNNNLNQRFDNFSKDLMVLMKHLEKSTPYPKHDKGLTHNKMSDSETQDDLVESEVRNSTIPKEWDKEDPMEEVNKSLHMIRQNTPKNHDEREE